MLENPTPKLVPMPLKRRRAPRPRELTPLVRFDRPVFSPQKRRLKRALTIADLRDAARKRAPLPVFDYTEGAAGSEQALTRARQAYSSLEFRPNVLRDVSVIDTRRRMLGHDYAMPFGIAPTGFTRMMHTDGELAGVTAAAQADIPFGLSTMGTTRLEQIAAAAPQARRFFQLYVWKDRARSVDLIKRAADAGFTTLMVTADVPVAGPRLRDQRNGLTIPPSLTARTALQVMRRPAWWSDLVTSEPLAFASLDSWPGTVAQLLDTMFDPTVTWDDLAWIRDAWPGTIIVKGVQTAEDAARAATSGADAVLLSNHGGRQLDRAPVPFHLLPEVVDAVGGDLEVHVDSGIMSGQDIVAALTQGASFVWVGRAYLYGLMAGGRAGVDRALEILRAEIELTMRLLGVRSLDELQASHVRLRRADELARGHLASPRRH